jgi:succinyl-CoA synthetase beta subunit
MIDQTKGSALLRGVRGAAPGNLTALVDAIMRIQRLAVDFSGVITELDVNPLVVHPKGCVALDALIVC